VGGKGTKKKKKRKQETSRTGCSPQNAFELDVFPSCGLMWELLGDVQQSRAKCPAISYWRGHLGQRAKLKVTLRPHTMTVQARSPDRQTEGKGWAPLWWALGEGWVSCGIHRENCLPAAEGPLTKGFHGPGDWGRPRSRKALSQSGDNDLANVA
jgi:hypothetical protein